MTAQGDLLAILFGPVDEPEPAPVPPAPAAHTRRHFYRCCDCLTVAATESQLGSDDRGRPVAVCDACGGAIEYMGVTHREVLTLQKGYRPICDGKCISARGPSCDCRCGGANHGSGMVVPVVETSSVPRLGIAGPQAKMAGEMWRALQARYKLAWRARFGYVIDQKNLGRYLDQTEWSRYCEAGRITQRYHGIKDGRTAARGKKLEQLIKEISAP